MAKHTYKLIKKIVYHNPYKLLHCTFVDKTSTVDNTSVIDVHAFVLSYYDQQSLIITLIKLENYGATIESLTCIIMSALLVNCYSDREAMTNNLICFGVNGVATFLN